MDTKKYPQIWVDRVDPFALAIGKSLEEVTEKLLPVVGDPSAETGALEAVTLLDNPEATPDVDIKEALKDLNIPSGKMNAHISKLRPEKKETPATVSSPGGMTTLSILPVLPDDVSFLEMLKTGGVLKVDVTEVISAIKAALAKTVGLFELPDKIHQKMEDFAVAQEEPCGESYYRIQKLLTQRQYGEVLSVIGVTGSFVSEKRKKDFFIKVDEHLWTALRDFNASLTAWQKSWTEGAGNPAMLMMAMMAGQTGNPTPPGMMAPPDTLVLRTAGEDVINEINKIFAGPGIPIARALAFDATRIMGILEDKELPVQMGAANKDQMLKELGISVGAGIVQIEQSLSRYALAIMSLPKVSADNELAYFAAMLKLGASIPWDKLGGKGLGIKNLR